MDAPSLDSRSVKRIFTAETLGEVFVRYLKLSSYELLRRGCNSVTDIATELLEN